ncbi:DarT ssDNA thymidine ADP-ribosyltransferase family protein [Aeromonas dhakensis]|uniref:DarT ssDNA thymidine ADP-ribosyltransferase family protein n=1 Tax=Aeromonas dhakensis TaxID=196024 RepID=UPI0038D07279
MSIKTQKQIYHLTALSNLASILKFGLLPRSKVGNFRDVADEKIIAKREELGLNTKVPFHFFANNPFDGRVLSDHPDEDFVLIAVSRTVAEKQKWWVVDKHPLATDVKVYSDYKEGMAAIEWDVMDKREYKDAHCKLICMAECVAPDTVPVSDFASFYVKDKKANEIVMKLLAEFKVKKYVDINAGMFK